jgi:hypothetical protein
MQQTRVMQFLSWVKSAVVLSLFIQTGINLYFFSFRDMFDDFKF